MPRGSGHLFPNPLPCPYRASPMPDCMWPPRPPLGPLPLPLPLPLPSPPAFPPLFLGVGDFGRSRSISSVQPVTMSSCAWKNAAYTWWQTENGCCSSKREYHGCLIFNLNNAQFNHRGESKFFFPATRGQKSETPKRKT